MSVPLNTKITIIKEYPKEICSAAKEVDVYFRASQQLPDRHLCLAGLQAMGRTTNKYFKLST